jgi:hypothetical protein
MKKPMEHNNMSEDEVITLTKSELNARIQKAVEEELRKRGYYEKTDKSNKSNKMKKKSFFTIFERISKMLEERDVRMIEKLAETQKLLQQQQITTLIELADKIAEAKAKQQARLTAQEIREIVNDVIKPMMTEVFATLSPMLVNSNVNIPVPTTSSEKKVEVVIKK